MVTGKGKIPPLDHGLIDKMIEKYSLDPDSVDMFLQVYYRNMENGTAKTPEDVIREVLVEMKKQSIVMQICNRCFYMTLVTWTICLAFLFVFWIEGEIVLNI